MRFPSDAPDDQTSADVLTDVEVIAAFSALSQATRLAAVGLLAEVGSDGMAVGEIARRLDVPGNTLSTHLAILARCGLVAAERRSRSIVYRADLGRLRALSRHLDRFGTS